MTIERLKTIGKHIAKLDADKRAAVAAEDYDLAKSLKAEIDRLRRESENPGSSQYPVQSGAAGAAVPVRCVLRQQRVSGPFLSLVYLVLFRSDNLRHPLPVLQLLPIRHLVHQLLHQRYLFLLFFFFFPFKIVALFYSHH